MSERLVYVVGPSGAGKDSVIGWVRQQLGQARHLHWARRTITRAARPNDEAHEAVDEDTFLTLQEVGAFSLHWQANGLHYGVRHEETAPLQHGHWVVVNGSRGHLAATRVRFPAVSVVHVTADHEILRRRLLTRGRESPADIEARLRRNALLLPTRSLEVLNDTSLEDAGRQFIAHLQSLPGWHS